MNSFSLFIRTMTCSLIAGVCLNATVAPAPSQVEEMPYIKNLVPQTAEVAHKNVQNTCADITKHLLFFSNEMIASNNFSLALPYWNAAYQRFLVTLASLNVSSNLNEKTPFQATLKREADALINCFTEALTNNEPVLKQIIHYVDSHNVIPPFEVYFLSNLFANYQQSALNGKYAKEIQQMQAKLQKMPQLPYVQAKGNGDAISSDTLSVFTLNTLCFPDTVSYYYGGASPLKNRIDKIADKILEIDADVVCLQETFSERAGWKLYSLLRDKYTYFYFNMGHAYSNILPDSYSYSSGLFVASKKKIANPQFIAFQVPGMQKGINRGYFTFEVWNEDKIQGLVATSHLQPFNDENSQMVRELQMKEIVNFFEKSSTLEAYKDIPFVLVGDLNVDWGTKEYSYSSVKLRFFDPYTLNQKPVTADNATCTNYLNDLIYTEPSLRGNIKPSFTITDYALLFVGKNKPFRKDIIMKTKRVDFFSIDKPLDALSDHNGLVTKISIDKR